MLPDRDLLHTLEAGLDADTRERLHQAAKAIIARCIEGLPMTLPVTVFCPSKTWSALNVSGFDGTPVKHSVPLIFTNASQSSQTKSANVVDKTRSKRSPKGMRPAPSVSLSRENSSISLSFRRDGRTT